MSAARQSAWCHWASAWRASLGFRIVAAILAVSLLLGVAATLYDYRDAERSAREELADRARSLARQAARWFPDAVLNRDTLLDEFVEDLVVDDKYVAFAVVRRHDGVQMAAFPAGAAAAADDPAELTVSEPIYVGNDRIGTFVCGLTLEPMHQALRERALALLLRSGLGFLVLAGLLWMVLRRLVVVPLGRLDHEAQRLGRGELAEPLTDFGTTELGRLGRTLDEMRQSLRTSHESLAHRNRQLVELDQLKSHFLANMSHEIRTPLTSILGGVELLADGALRPEDRETVAAVQRNGEQLLELVDRLLDLAKLEAGSLLFEKRPVRLDEIVYAVGARFRTQLRPGVELDVEAGTLGEQLGWTDPSRLRQALASVVGNAVKFTSAGRVAVHAGLEEVAGVPTLRLVVTDTGVGIPRTYLPHLFEPFSQADGSLTRRHGGTGMGLAMAAKIVRQLGGEIAVESEVGRGTCVEIELPVGPPPYAAAPSPAAVALDPCERGGRILVVDDAVDSQRLFRAMLRQAGFTVALAGDGREAVDAVTAAAAAEPFDLVLMDLQMPGLDGVSAIRELRGVGCTVPIVALTAHALAEDRQRCLAAGADGYETKPITRARLLEVVAERLAAARA